MPYLVTPGTYPGTRFTLADLGMPNAKHPTQIGSMVVTLETPFPQNMQARFQILFRRRRQSGERPAPEAGAAEQAVQD